MCLEPYHPLSCYQIPPARYPTSITEGLGAQGQNDQARFGFHFFQTEAGSARNIRETPHCKN